MTGRVLFVDDEPNVVSAVAEILREDGAIDVVSAEDGPSALDMLQSHDIDIVISDYAMPGMNGIELFHKIRALSPEMPLIMLTGYRETVEKEILETLGAEVAVLDKPWETGSPSGSASAPPTREPSSKPTARPPIRRSSASRSAFPPLRQADRACCSVNSANSGAPSNLMQS